ncbi:MAG: hypothetical protein Q3999_07515 [Buchananella hordeovulneris]|nr:hypothetical protein [Buchananella hordeovulneris]
MVATAREAWQAAGTFRSAGSARFAWPGPGFGASPPAGGGEEEQPGSDLDGPPAGALGRVAVLGGGAGVLRVDPAALEEAAWRLGQAGGELAQTLALVGAVAQEIEWKAQLCPAEGTVARGWAAQVSYDITRAQAQAQELSEDTARAARLYATAESEALRTWGGPGGLWVADSFGTVWRGGAKLTGWGVHAQRTVWLLGGLADSVAWGILLPQIWRYPSIFAASGSLDAPGAGRTGGGAVGQVRGIPTATWMGPDGGWRSQWMPGARRWRRAGTNLALPFWLPGGEGGAPHTGAAAALALGDAYRRAEDRSGRRLHLAQRVIVPGYLPGPGYWVTNPDGGLPAPAWALAQASGHLAPAGTRPGAYPGSYPGSEPGLARWTEPDAGGAPRLGDGPWAGLPLQATSAYPWLAPPEWAAHVGPFGSGAAGTASAPGSASTSANLPPGPGYALISGVLLGGGALPAQAAQFPTPAGAPPRLGPVPNAGVGLSPTLGAPVPGTAPVASPSNLAPTPTSIPASTAATPIPPGPAGPGRAAVPPAVQPFAATSSASNSTTAPGGGIGGPAEATSSTGRANARAAAPGGGVGGAAGERRPRVGAPIRVPDNLEGDIKLLRALPKQEGSMIVGVVRAPGAATVYIPGTNAFLPGTSSPLGMESNLDLIAGRRGHAETAVAAALEAAGVGPGEKVTLVGHSQGGMTALALAADPIFQQRYNVSNVVAFGAPIATEPLPAHINVIAVENTQDPVSALDGRANPVGENWMTATVDTTHLGVKWNHSLPVMQEAARLADAYPQADWQRRIRDVHADMAGRGGDAKIPAPLEAPGSTGSLLLVETRRLALSGGG